MNLRTRIRDIPNFPKPGIMFRDITPLLKDKVSFRKAISLFKASYKGKRVDYIAGIESRGFIFGSALALEMGLGFIPIRKQGKLPYEKESISYDLEYGSNTLEIHKDALKKGDRVIVIDDLLATGGSCSAACALIEKLGGQVIGVGFVVELLGLKGKNKLIKYPIVSLLKYK